MRTLSEENKTHKLYKFTLISPMIEHVLDVVDHPILISKYINKYLGGDNGSIVNYNSIDSIKLSDHNNNNNNNNNNNIMVHNYN
jgi:hypothetical protein